MNKNKQHSLHLLISAIFFALVALFLIISIWEDHNEFAKYEKGEVVLVTIEHKPKIGRFTYAVYGTYEHNGRVYTNVNMKNCMLNKVGDVIACKILPGNPLYVCNSSVPVTPMMIVKYIAIAVMVFFALMTSYSLYRHNHMMEYGHTAIGKIKSVIEKDELVYGLVEFTDYKEKLQLAEICFEKKLVVRGQRCNIKYMIHEDGTVEAYYYDTRE